MTDLPLHHQPVTPEECRATWKSRGRIPVPTRKGRIMDMAIERLYECSSVNGLPLDLLLDARASKRAPLKTFGVIFSDRQPVEDYPIPVLWVNEGKGTWIALP